jgi:transposase
MFIRTKKRANGKISVQIVESYRRGNKVNQKILRHVGQAINEEEVKLLKRLASSIVNRMKNDRQPKLPLFSPTRLPVEPYEEPIPDLKVNVKDLREEQRTNTGIKDVFGKLINDLSFNSLISGGRKKEQWNRILQECVLARIANPQSKRRTASLLEEDYGIKVPLEKIYRMMDHLAEEEESIKKRIAGETCSLFDQKVDVLFFDVTTLYFESFSADELRNFGFSKDCKFKETQVVLALVATTEGLPITYRVFPGNTYEGHTLLNMVDDLKQNYDIKNIVLVADRAMFTEKNLEKLDSLKINYIVAAKLKTLPNKLKNQITAEDGYSLNVIKNEFHWCKEFEHKSRRLIVSYSKKRAQKDSADRQRLVERLMKKVKDGKLKVGDLVTNRGTKKYIKVLEDQAIVNEAKISDDAIWDGLHGVISNCQDKTPRELLSRYRDLWQIEAAFRINKHDLKMRPIYHWTEPRIKAHISICFIAYSLIKHALYRLKIQQKMDISFEQLREELLHIQSSVVMDLQSKKRFILPSKYTINQKNIYKAFGLKRREVPYLLR